MGSNITSFNSDTAKAASQKSVAVRRQKAVERAKLRSAMVDEVDRLLADFANNKPVMNTKLSAEVRARMLENVITAAMIQRMSLAMKFDYEADLLELKAEIKQEETEVDRDTDNRTGLTSTDIMNLVGTQSESISSSKVITLEKHDVEVIDIDNQTFLEWYNIADDEIAGSIIELYFNGSQDEFFAQSDRPASEVIRERGIKCQRV